MTPITFVSYFTPAYRAEADELRATLDRFSLPHDIRSMEDFGEWTVNCGQKASFVREMVRQHPNNAIVWLDADARVQKPPELFATLAADVAFHLHKGYELLSSTLYFEPTVATIELLDDWHERCGRQPNRWDQIVLHEAIRSRPSLRLSHLPQQYACIFDSGPLPPDEAIILQTQASRRLKNARA